MRSSESFASANALPFNTVKTLLGHALDYAGVFPPAQLPFGEAIREFSRCRRDPNAWFLARFVLPVGRIGEFAQAAGAELAESSATRQPWHVTGLLRTAGSIDEALASLKSDAHILRGFADAHPDSFVVDSCELPLPEEVLNTHDQDIARGFFAEAAMIFDHFHLGCSVYWEVQLAKSFAHVALAAHQANLLQPGRMGLKFRTGALTAAAMVSPELLARAFRLALQERVPFKLTAGLHLAMRHFDTSVGADVFGFLNVFVAAVLGWKYQLSETELRLLLEEKDPRVIAITAEGITWKNYHATVADIRFAREGALRSFGSCSFFEPVEDLQNLKLIP